MPVCGIVGTVGDCAKAVAEQDHIRTTAVDGAIVRVVSVEVAGLAEWPQPGPVAVAV